MTDAKDEAAADAPAAWEPEPREWTWMDVFKAPMIACKFRCMLISVVTIAAIGLINAGFNKISLDAYSMVVIGPVLKALHCIIPAIIFGLGGTLVAIFIKSELLDDDYPSVGEALGQFKKRFAAAIMVPLFLLGAVHGMHLGAYIWDLICSIPYIGSLLYLASIPAYFLWLLIIFFTIGVGLSIFVFPAIVAIRKHGWFDNVIDTLEAVGTKPHRVFGAIAVTAALMFICCGIGFLALNAVKGMAQSPHLPSHEVVKTERAADHWLDYTIPAPVESFRRQVTNSLPVPGTGSSVAVFNAEAVEISGWHKYVTGLLAGGFQTLVIYLIAGYGLNIFIAGGMLSYLHVREDDYWDDEDLADLEKLARELEDEALKDQGDNTPAKADGAAPTADKADGDRKDDDSPAKADDAEKEKESDTDEAEEKPKKRKSTKSRKSTASKKSSARKTSGRKSTKSRKSSKTDDKDADTTDDDKKDDDS